MNFLTLLFSGPGATIFICVTVLLLAVIYLIFHDRFRGLSLGYKELKFETPKTSEVTTQSSTEVIPESAATAATPVEVEGAKQYPIIALLDGVRSQDREAIEKAYDQLKDNPPFGYTSQQFEAFKFNQLLRAGFPDALEKLQELEQKSHNHINASLYLARYFFNARAFDQAETYLTRAKNRAQTDSDLVDTALLKAEFVEFSQSRLNAAELLEKELPTIAAADQRFRLLDEIGRLYKEAHNDVSAIVAYEMALKC